METRLRSLMASLSVHVEAWMIEEPTNLLDAGQPVVAFETLVENLYDGEAGLYPGEIVEIQSIGADLNSARRALGLIHELVRPGG